MDVLIEVVHSIINLKVIDLIQIICISMVHQTVTMLIRIMAFIIMKIKKGLMVINNQLVVGVVDDIVKTRKTKSTCQWFSFHCFQTIAFSIENENLEQQQQQQQGENNTNKKKHRRHRRKTNDNQSGAEQQTDGLVLSWNLFVQKLFDF